ncbi:MAG: cyclic nucleotide-binding domain-containing protein, partial [Solirubrobacterales bacterium]|nr:cyclic nucleotide-binding domain-containing protein [Solirubrobacterales bacterium]
ARPITVADLRPVDLFEDIDDAALSEWAAEAQWRIAEPGEVVIPGDEPARGLWCLLEGSLQTFVRDGERLEPVNHQDAPTWIGAVPTLTETPITARMVALTAARLALIPAPEFRRLALAHPAVHRKIMLQVRPVVARFAAIQQNRERLAALGTMAAGLAHELNNPASAARRSAADLAEALGMIGAAIREFTDAGIEREDAARIADLREQALRQCAARDTLSALDAADAEDEMRDRLEELEIPDAWRLAEPLAAAGLDGDWLAQLHALAGPATPAAIRWIVGSLSAQRLASDLRESTERMSSLIGAVKAYAYMDRGGLVEADVHEGLETTLKVLGHKVKHKEIEIRREYDRSLPPLTIYGSELNQVWTNLLDNAIDAVGERGTITVRTRADGECILVDIADTGPGIPPDIRSRVFEPFFTTKDVGSGTGLGLDTARRIVIDRHGGSMTFDTSEQGTTFHVWLRIHPSSPVRTENQP